MQASNSTKSLFPQRLADLMSQKGINQSILSQRSGVNQSGISKYLRGDSSPRAGELARMADALGIDMGELWHGVSQKKLESKNRQEINDSREMHRDADLTLSPKLLDRLDARADDLGLDRMAALTMIVKKGLDRLDRLDQLGMGALADPVRAEQHDLAEGLRNVANDIIARNKDEDYESGYDNQSGKNAG